MIAIFPGHRALAREYFEVLFSGVGRIMSARERIEIVSTRGPVAVVSDFNRFSGTDQKALLRNFGHVFMFWWNNEQELLQSAERDPELLVRASVTHCFFYDEPTKRVEALGAAALFVRPFFASSTRFTHLAKVIGGSLSRYLVAMEVDWNAPADRSTSQSRYNEANSDRRWFLRAVAKRRDLLFVGQDLRTVRQTSLPTIPQRTSRGPQIMPLMSLLSRGVIEIGSKSASSSITPRMADALSVGTPVHALRFSSDVATIDGVQWYNSVHALASIPPPRKVTICERKSIVSAFQLSQVAERARVLNQMGISSDL